MNDIPKLRTMRDSNPITGEVHVVDENNHQVACFRIKRPECHVKGANTDVMDAGRNMVMAQSLIELLYVMWEHEIHNHWNVTNPEKHENL